MNIKNTFFEYIQKATLSLFLATVSFSLAGHPAQVSKVCKSTPPFFTKEFYANAHKRPIKNDRYAQQEKKER